MDRKKYIIEVSDDIQRVMAIGVAEDKTVFTCEVKVAALEELTNYINENFGSLQDEAYQAGLNDAWEAAKKIVVDTAHGGIALCTLGEIFGARGYDCIMRENTAQEAIDKIKAYEDKHSDRIEVGDEVRNKVNGLTYIVTLASECGYVLLGSDGNCATSCVTNSFEKTGKHYDIQSILEAMRT